MLVICNLILLFIVFLVFTVKYIIYDFVYLHLSVKHLTYIFYYFICLLPLNSTIIVYESVNLQKQNYTCSNRLDHSKKYVIGIQILKKIVFLFILMLNVLNGRFLPY